MTTVPLTATQLTDEHAATRALWSFLALPYDTEDAAQALFGVPPTLTRQLAGVLLASSAEASHLLDTLPRNLRSLVAVTHERAVRCVGEVRGPILWGETVAARSSGGRTDVFVCTSSVSAYDTPENRVLVAALRLIVDGGHVGDPLATLVGGPDLQAQVRERATRARHLLEHRALAGVGHERPDGRTLARLAKGNRRRTYQGALALHERHRQRLTVDELLGFLDKRTSRQHQVLLGVAERLSSAGTALTEPVPHPHGHLDMAPVTFRHPTVAAGRDPSGILGPGVVVDVPDPIDHPDLAKAAADLARWNPGQRTVLVVSDADLDTAASALQAGMAGP